MTFFPSHRSTPASQSPSRPAPPTSPEPETPSAPAEPERFPVAQPRYTLEEVVMPESAVGAVNAALARLAHHHTLYEDWDLGAIDPTGRRAVINLHGPPGTGKSMCAEGIAHRLGRPILTVSYAELESKYVGDTPKNIVAVFSAARTADAVLFFDEADSILGRRLTSVTQSADHGVNVSRAMMLTQLDGFDGVVVFATNLMRNYDEAFVRRILAHVELPLPDLPCRTRLATRFLRPRMPLAADVTVAWLADQSEGLSGGEMKQVVIAAASRAVARPAETRRVDRDDLAAELGNLRQARRAVRGEPTLAEPRVTETIEPCPAHLRSVVIPTEDQRPPTEV